jgi:hypothetical protein
MLDIYFILDFGNAVENTDFKPMVDKRIPYHMPGFWYSFLPKPPVGKNSMVDKAIPYHLPGSWYSYLPKPTVGKNSMVDKTIPYHMQGLWYSFLPKTPMVDKRILTICQDSGIPSCLNRLWVRIPWWTVEFLIIYQDSGIPSCLKHLWVRIMVDSRIPHHIPGFWYSFLPCPPVGKNSMMDRRIPYHIPGFWYSSCLNHMWVRIPW